MVVEVRLPTLVMLPYFDKQDICSIIDTHKISKTRIYFPPKYTFDPKGSRAELFGDIHKAVLVGGDRITLWGKGKGLMQVMDIRYIEVRKLTSTLGL
jgi:hypothetical protein